MRTPAPDAEDKAREPALKRVLDRVVRIATALRPLAARLPVFPPSVAMAAALNAVFAGAEKEDFELLAGKVLAIHVPDAGLRFQFRLRDGVFVAAPAGYAPDVVISAGAGDFLDLAARRVDADTLFFSRRLAMEGDTELGLLLKNRLDALDVKLGPGLFPRPLALLKALGTASGWPAGRRQDAFVDLDQRMSKGPEGVRARPLSGHNILG